MAIGTIADVQIYDDEFHSGVQEVLVQQTGAFNAASNGAIVLETRNLIGEYEREAFFKAITNLIARRDPTSVAGVTDQPLTEAEHVGVKLNRRLGPVASTMDAWRKIGMSLDANPESSNSEMSFKIGQQAGAAIMIDYLNSALRAATAAITNNAAVVHDYSATGTITHTELVTGLSKFGDMAADIVFWVGHSKTYFDLIKQALADKVFEVAGATIHAGTVPTLGRPFLYTDAAPLFVAGTPNTYWLLGLTANAVRVTESEGRYMIAKVITGLENLVVRLQGEHAFNLKVKGYSWDTTNGGVNPADAAVATGTNWDKVVTDNKNTAGIAIKVQ